MTKPSMRFDHRRSHAALVPLLVVALGPPMSAAHAQIYNARSGG